MAGRLVILSLSLCYKADDNTKSSNIKETDGWNVDFLNGGAPIILLETYAIWEKIICGITAGCRRQTEQCMECPSFCSTRENLDEYAAEIKRARTMLQVSQMLGREEWIKKNQEYLDRLIRIQKELLEKGVIHKSGSMREA
ncbi:MAG: hypothetical protein LUJ25_08100 [Firmicutes bacterium]|nr:hypothetical protein [Bacillota bacterium]